MTTKPRLHHDILTESHQLITVDIKTVYEKFWPIEYRVRETGAIAFKVVQQLGSMIFESRDQTHFILRGPKLYDLLKPQEYEHKVMTYNPDKGEWGVQFYGREAECRAWVIRWQEHRYGFDHTEYVRLLGQTKRYEQQLAENSEHFSEQENDELQNLLHTVLSNIRIALKLPIDGDLPDLTVEEAQHEP